jgi:hypothetical protein
VRATGQAAVPGQLAHRAFETRGGRGERDGDRGERPAGGEDLRPLALCVAGSGQAEVHRVVRVADLPGPRTVVLDLPDDRPSGLRVRQRAHRQVLGRGPRAGAGQGDAVARVGPVGRGQPALGEAGAGPAALAAPRVGGGPDGEAVLPEVVTLDRQQAGYQQRGDVQEDEFLLPRGDPGPAADRRDSRMLFEAGDDGQIGDGVVRGDLQHRARRARSDDLVRHVLQTGGQTAADVPLAVDEVARVAREFDVRQRQ